MEDKRKFIRFSVSLDAKSRAAGWFRPKAKYSVKDVSREGLKLNTKEALKEGDMLELELSVPGKRPPITAMGQVVWNHKLGEAGYDIGLKFKTINPEDKFEILDYAYNKWIRSRKTL
ncbi:MAG: PilZ domain-containing protein [Candidatus Omnitrophica bacterium]|nr:PilZ domain-containing protein [Candidatus Omnitrophota bacterium]